MIFSNKLKVICKSTKKRRARKTKENLTENQKIVVEKFGYVDNFLYLNKNVTQISRISQIYGRWPLTQMSVV